jgi:DNA-binding XRE family transcriptional regulator
MSVIDWNAKPEPWRTIGKRFCIDLLAMAGGAAPSPPPDNPSRGPATPTVAEDGPGRRLQDLRFALRLTQVQVARRAEISDAIISKAEHGYIPKKVFREAMARALNVRERDIWPG